MTIAYECDAAFYVREGVTSVINADDEEQANDFMYEYVKETYPEATDIDVIHVREVKKV